MIFDVERTDAVRAASRPHHGIRQRIRQRRPDLRQTTPGQPGRIRAEADHLVALAGPGVVPLRRVSGDGDDVELHLEAAASSVADVLAERGRLSEREARAVGVAAARALSRVHGAGLVHGDVKPANLLLTTAGELWLTDLDAAARADGRVLRRCSPGRTRRGATAVPATDVISLAVAVVELVTGVVPDPDLSWSRADLTALDCPPLLAADLSAVLASASAPAAEALADRLACGEDLALPEPARARSLVDPTPTLDFDPVIVETVLRPVRDEKRDPTVVILVVLAAVVLAVVIGSVVATPA